MRKVYRYLLKAGYTPDEAKAMLADKLQLPLARVPDAVGEAVAKAASQINASAAIAALDRSRMRVVRSSR